MSSEGTQDSEVSQHPALASAGQGLDLLFRLKGTLCSVFQETRRAWKIVQTPVNSIELMCF